ncbi:MAG TPA: DUF4926 domain-containing protein [Candidatus Hydrogenedentes bacterium]|nr:DUF4926 domain-containing protein [Candidatus Hydrogenedentota bacterium]
MIKELDRVVLTRPVPEEGLEPGDVGAVVHVYGDGEAYEVEFTTLDGRTAAVVTLEADAIRPVTGGDISHARALSTSS